MRYSIILILVLSINLNAQNLRQPQQAASLYTHLCEINSYWLSQATPVGLLDDYQFRTHEERIQKHLQLVEHKLRQRPTTHLTAAQRIRRIGALDALREYWQQGRFPQNTTPQTKIPIFIDAQGTACAVSYLLLETGETALVDDIQRNDNFAYLPDLLVYDGLPKWAEKYGFTYEELAWIQPAYFSIVVTPTPFRNNLGLNEGEKVNDLQVFNDELYLAGNFTRIDDFACNAIAIWDGEDLRTLPGLDANIKKLAMDNDTGDLYAIGDFWNFMDGDEQAVMVRYRNQEWEALLYANDFTTYSIINDIICENGFCYIAGDFNGLSNTTASNLAVYDINDANWNAFREDVNINGHINDMDIRGDSLVIGGDFHIINNNDTISELLGLFSIQQQEILQTSLPLSTDTLLEVQFVELVENNLWWLDELNSVTIIKTSTGPVLTLPGSYPAHLSWDNSENSVANGIHIQHEWFGYIYGYFPDLDTSANQNVCLQFPGPSAAAHLPIIQANNEITALTYFNNAYFIAGKFTTFSGEQINQVATATIITDTDDIVSSSPIAVSTDGQTIFIDNLPVDSKDNNFELFDQQGRRVWSQPLPTLTSSSQLKPKELPAAAYVYRIVAGDQVGVGQIVLIRNE